MGASLAAELSGVALAHPCAVALLLGARLLPVAVLAPWLAFFALPSWIVPVVLVGLCLAFFPLVLPLAPPALALGAELVPAALSELVRGGVLAFVALLPLHAFAWTGRIVDTLRAELDEAASGLLGKLYGTAAVALFFASGGHELFVTALAGDLRERPLGSPLGAQGLRGVLVASAELAGKAFELAVALCAPVLFCVLSAALVLGVFARVASPLARALAQAPLLPIVGVATFFLTAGRMLDELPAVLRVFVSDSLSLLRKLG